LADALDSKGQEEKCSKNEAIMVLAMSMINIMDDTPPRSLRRMEVPVALRDGHPPHHRTKLTNHHHQKTLTEAAAAAAKAKAKANTSATTITHRTISNPDDHHREEEEEETRRPFIFPTCWMAASNP
jgi:hypothetical protein